MSNITEEDDFFSEEEQSRLTNMTIARAIENALAGRSRATFEKGYARVYLTKYDSVEDVAEYESKRASLEMHNWKFPVYMLGRGVVGKTSQQSHEESPYGTYLPSTFISGDGRLWRVFNLYFISLEGEGLMLQRVTSLQNEDQTAEEAWDDISRQPFSTLLRYNNIFPSEFDTQTLPLHRNRQELLLKETRQILNGSYADIT